MDLRTLAETMRVWASDELNRLDRTVREDVIADGNDLSRFDEHMARARAHLEGVVAVEAAWREDNPEAFTDEEATR